MRVGNDVVDLRAADNRPAAIHPGFDARVFTSGELGLLGACPDDVARHSLRWTLWAAKESTLKLLRKDDPRLAFHPAAFEVRPEEDLRSALVTHGGTVTHVAFDRDAERVHAVATASADEATGEVVAGTARIDPGSSPAAASRRARELAADAVVRLLGLGSSGHPEAASVTISAAAHGLNPARRKVPQARLGTAELPVDVSLSHDGSWLAHAIVRTGAALAMLFAVAGCSEATGPDRDLERAAARWVEQDLSRYSYVFDQSCFCGFTGPVRLSVRDGDVVAARSLPGSSDPDTVQDPNWFPTIDELFDRLRSAVESDAVVFLVTYDSALGFPASASVDISEQIADEEYAFEVRDVIAE